MPIFFSVLFFHSPNAYSTLLKFFIENLAFNFELHTVHNQGHKTCCPATHLSPIYQLVHHFLTTQALVKYKTTCSKINIVRYCTVHVRNWVLE